MELRDILPFIFWPWFLMSCVILVRRRLNRAAEPTTETTSIPSMPPSVPARLPPSPPATSPAPPASSTGSGPPGSPTPGTPGLDRPNRSDGSWSTDERSPTADQAAATALPADLVPSPPPTSSIFDEPADTPTGTARRPIAELVTGIRMPCDLAPLVGIERPPGAREVVAFVTRTADATLVGRAMGAEMRRLGFTLHARHATEVVALRDDEALVVSVHDQAHDVRRGERLAFPGAGEGAVVVELWLD